MCELWFSKILTTAQIEFLTAQHHIFDIRKGFV